MAEKRKMSTRSGGEPLKKRASTPVPPPQPPVQPLEDGLPVRFKDGEDLPTLAKQQDKNLPSDQYQTIAERFVTVAQGS
jgi:hypothetical protein